MVSAVAVYLATSGSWCLLLDSVSEALTLGWEGGDTPGRTLTLLWQTALVMSMAVVWDAGKESFWLMASKMEI